MTLRVPDLGLGDGKTGDTELKIRQDYNHNFNDQSNAASRLVGPVAGNVMEVGAFGVGGLLRETKSYAKPSELPLGLRLSASTTDKLGIMAKAAWQDAAVLNMRAWDASHLAGAQAQLVICGSEFLGFRAGRSWDGSDVFDRDGWIVVWSSANATKDPNGFLKGASPIAEIYSDSMILNRDAQQQGGITFEKLGVGDYLVKGSLGFAQEGWYIETPKDANGNVLVAVVYEQLANNDISIKTYAKKFDDETGDIVPNLLKPRDIPAGRFISLRLHELPKEPPVMPVDTQPEI